MAGTATSWSTIAAVFRRITLLEGERDFEKALPSVLEELRTALEELYVAHEEMQMRRDELEHSDQLGEAQRRRYADLFDLAPDAYLVTDRDHRIVDANRAVEVLLARERAACLGKPLPLFMPPAERMAFRRRLAELGPEGRIVGWDLELLHPGGESVPVSASVGPVVDDDGQVAGHRWIFRDETEVLGARRELAASETRSRAIFEADSDGLITVDESGTISFLNSAAAGTFGYAPAELLGRDVGKLIEAPLPVAGASTGFMARYVAGGAVVASANNELKGCRRDGSRFPLRVAMSEFEDRDGRAFALRLRDVSAEKESEAALDRFEQMTELSSDLMAFIDRDLIVRAVNDAYAAVFDSSRQEMIGRPIAEIVGPETFSGYLGPMLEAGLAGRSMRAERWYISPSGRDMYLDVRYAPHRDADGAVDGVIIDARDRTELRKLEDEVERRRAEIAHVGRLSTLGELASGLAHELNQPLSAIASYCAGASRMLERGAGSTEDLITTMRACAAQARRAGEIIRRMRTLVRRDQGERSTNAVNAIVTDVVGLLESEARRKQVRMATVLADGLPEVLVDRVQIEQVLLNLVLNALEAVDDADVPRREVVLTTAHFEDGGVAIEVRDTGPGLDEEVAGHLFTPFFTTKPGGMGIGLSICRGIAEAHGGTLTAHDAPEGGALMRLVLPGAPR